jgi:hypothetical protein
VSRGLQALLGIAGLVAVVLLANAAMEAQRRSEAKRAAEHPAAPVPAAPLPPSRMGPVEGTPGPPPTIPVKFVEVDAAAAGVDFVHTWGGGIMDNLVKTSGGGVTLLDFDGDGDLDLYFLQGSCDPVAAPGETPAEPPRNRLYRNDGGWRFTDATDASGLGDEGYGLGAAAADYDGDGDEDLFVANFGRCRLYRNDGGRFADVTAAAGIDLSGFYVGAAWGDADGDGNLDLLVCGYLRFDPAVKPSGPRDPFAGPRSFPGEPVRLLLGRADGTFEDATKRAGLWTTEGRGMSVAFSDLLGKGAPLLLVSNDSVPNFAFERRAGGHYVDVGFPLGLAYSDLGQARTSMGIAVFDADRDGRPDVVLPDGSGGTFYRNLGGRLEDQARVAGLDGAMLGRTGWSAVPVDYDLDGWPDLALTCGALHDLQPQKPVLFRNGGDGRFYDVSAAVSFGRHCIGRGCGAGDLDGDGDPDVVIATLGAKPLLLRNDGGEARRSLLVRCVAKGRNRDALGARVEVEAGGLVQREEVRTTQGYLSGSGPALLFGLGAEAKASRVRVEFPGGAVRELRDVPGGRAVVEE